MRVIVGCEYSGIVRDAFLAVGHDAWSCDIEPSEKPDRRHLQCDVEKALRILPWDLAILHPPCTHLAVSGARWFEDKRKEQIEAVAFFFRLAMSPVERIAIENPVGIMSSLYRKPDQIIQPWQFGHGETKATCLWLKGLPKLKPTNIVEGREHRIHRMAPGPDRAKERSRTYTGIAQAMAEQWGTR